VERLAAVAAIRTFPSDSLDREVESTRRLRHVDPSVDNAQRRPAA
jgi:hypothetical protein